MRVLLLLLLLLLLPALRCPAGVPFIFLHVRSLFMSFFAELRKSNGTVTPRCPALQT